MTSNESIKIESLIAEAFVSLSLGSAERCVTNMKKYLFLLIMIITLLVSGCVDKKAEVEHKAENKNEEDLQQTEEVSDYTIPNLLLIPFQNDTENFVNFFKISYTENEAYSYIEANEDGSVSIGMNGNQQKEFKKIKEKEIEEIIEEAEQNKDIEVVIDKEYKEVKFIMGEKSDSDGFMTSAIEIMTRVGVWQIVNGSGPEDWEFHFVVEREGKNILDVNVPEDKWIPANEGSRDKN